MNLDNLNKWLTLVANLGVVVGIFFLAIEIRQNQQTLEQTQALIERDYDLAVVDNLQQIADTSDDMRMLFLQYPEIAELNIRGRAGEELSEVDAMRYRSLCGMQIWNDAVTHKRNLVLGRDDLARAEEVGIRDRIRKEPGFKKCWESQVDGMRLWGVGDLVDGVYSEDIAGQNQE